MIEYLLNSKLGKNLRKKIEKKFSYLENSHLGESCYIFGDGASLKFYDLKYFKDKIGIACNHFPFHIDFSKANIKYAVLIEPFYFMPFFDKIYKKRKVSTKFFFNPISFEYRKIVKKNKDVNFFISLSNILFFYGKNVNYLYREILNKKSKDDLICKKFNCDKGVLRRAISLAVFLGFKEINLVGCDYLLYPRLLGHWYEYGKPKKHFKRDIDYIEKFILEFEKLKINFNVIVPFESDSSIKTINYETFYNTKINYKENFKLLKKNYLKIFDMQKTMKLFKY